MGGPSDVPSKTPSDVPSKAPSDVPSDTWGDVPSKALSDVPSKAPSDVPSDAPSDVSSEAPSNVPSKVPSDVPSEVPSNVPSKAPSDVPSDTPSDVPSDAPSDVPSKGSSDVPSKAPSVVPSKAPSTSPSAVPSTSPSVQPSVSQMPSESPTIDSTVAFAVTLCTSDCANAVAILNADAEFQKGLGNIMDPKIEVPVTVDEGSGTCTPTPGCTGRRFLFPVETDKDMSPATSDDSEGRLLTFSTTVVNIIVDMAETGESVNPTQLLEQFEDNKSDLDQAGLTIEGVVLATQSPSSFPSSDDGTTTTPPNPAPYGIPTFPPIPPIPTLLPVASPSPAPTKPT